MSTHDPSASIRFGLSGHPPHTHTHEPISDGRRIFVLPQLRICIRLTAKSAQCHHLPDDVDIDHISHDALVTIRKLVRWALNEGRSPTSLWALDGELRGVRYTTRALSDIWRRLPSHGDHDTQDGVAGGQPEDVPAPTGPENASQLNRQLAASPSDINATLSQPTPVRVLPIGHFAGYGVFSSENGRGQTGQTPTFNNLDNRIRPDTYLETDKHQPSPASAAGSTIVVQAELPERMSRSQRSSAVPATSPAPEFALGANESSDTVERHVAGDFSPSAHAGAGPLASMASMEKRSGSPLPVIPKRSRLATPPQTSHGGFDLERLALDQHVKEGMIYQVIKAAAALCPLSVRVLHPLLLNGQEPPQDLDHDLAANAGTITLAPTNLNNHTHWILAVISENVVTIFDSKPAFTDKGAIRRRLRHLSPHFRRDADVTFHQCAEQTNDADSGVAVMVNALHIISGQQIPAMTDYGIWRPILAALASGAHHDSFLSDIKLQAPLVSTQSIVIPPALPPIITLADYHLWHKQQATYMEDVARVMRTQHNKVWSDGLQVAAGLKAVVMGDLAKIKERLEELRAWGEEIAPTLAAQ
ncbi:hypothetical protein CGGC5_v016050 [Colletotrichum fructicola Nara gc5]|uniref:Ulp1 protease family protein n=1 Tax=Colletotrichum fructicola (strain Nara gc5) TaxID=1213859 RepID=A0A7J6IH23_COLFN|nr:hypothetical protein CGGC5_v016050 [Colletotrichum fructicola Nara gc5]